MAIYTDHNSMLNPSIGPSADALLNAITATNEGYYGNAQAATQDKAYNPFKIDEKSQADAQAQHQANVAQWLSPVSSNAPGEDEKYTDKHHEHFEKEMMNDPAMKALAPHIDEAEAYIQQMRANGASNDEIGSFVKNFGMQVIRPELEKHHGKHSDSHTKGIFDSYGKDEISIPNNIKNKQGAK